MKDKAFTKLLKKTSKLAFDHSQLLALIDAESEKRHGYFPSQVDCDEIIDVLQYGGGADMSAEEFDCAMEKTIELNTDHEGSVKTI